LISSSDRRVLDELAPDSTQTARDRQPVHNWPKGDLFTPRFSRQPYWPVIINQTIHSKTSNRFANSRPTRLACQLEAQLDHSTILSNVCPEIADLIVRQLGSFETFNPGAGSSSSPQTFQETATTQWQKN
jgi:hypothetical protein